MAGELVTQTARQHGARIVPVDSEHSAIWQCLRGERSESVRRLILTASGGALRSNPVVRAGFGHPSPGAGPSQTGGWVPRSLSDTATMINKGPGGDRGSLPLRHPLRADRCPDPPPEARFHSAVEFCDGDHDRPAGGGRHAGSDRRWRWATVRRLPGVVGAPPPRAGGTAGLSRRWDPAPLPGAGPWCGRRRCGVERPRRSHERRQRRLQWPPSSKARSPSLRSPAWWQR